MSTHIAGSFVRRLLTLSCFAIGINVGIAAAPAHAQSAAISPDALATARADSMDAGDYLLLQPLQRIMDLDSALAMSALPRLRLDATRDLARATVINHRETGDSLRSGTSRQRGTGMADTRYKSGLEDEARRRLRMTNANVDLAYVTSAIALQQAALRMIDDQLTAGLQTESARMHIASARQYTLERLKYAEALRREMVGERVDGR